MTKLTIITGASQNHFKSLVAFLESLKCIEDLVSVYIWDFGLDIGSRGQLETILINSTLRIFNYSKYPAYFNINIAAGEYAWKPAAIWETALEVRYGPILWCDAGNRLDGPIQPLIDSILSQGIYSPISAGTIQKWTFSQTLQYMNVPDRLLGMPARNGAIIGFDLSNIRAFQILAEWYRLANIRECIAPEGSNRLNHRQDQAVLTILYYEYTQGKELLNHYISLKTHCDID
jgi:hypothetical protein